MHLALDPDEPWPGVTVRILSPRHCRLSRAATDENSQRRERQSYRLPVPIDVAGNYADRVRDGKVRIGVAVDVWNERSPIDSIVGPWAGLRDAHRCNRSRVGGTSAESIHDSAINDLDGRRRLGYEHEIRRWTADERIRG